MGGQSERVAVVTGSSSGLGLRCSIALAREGYYVFASMRDLSRNGPLLQAAREAGVAERIESVQLDVTDEQMVNDQIRVLAERRGRIDVLINNAGIAIGGFVEEVDMSDWRRQFETNVFGMVAATRAVLPFMRERRNGTIVNIGSVSGKFGYPALGPYCASKHAVAGFSESLRLEVKPFGINVILIEPGSYRTEIWDKSLAGTASDCPAPYAAYKEAILTMIRATAASAGDPDEVVRTVMRAIRTPNPKLRYVVGRGARLTLGLKAVLPWRWLERIILNRMLGAGRSDEM